MINTLDSTIARYRGESRFVLVGKLTAVRSALDEGKRGEAERLLRRIADECAREGLTTTASRLRRIEL